MSVHSDAAQARVLEVRAMRQQIPNFVIPTTKDERRRLAPAASVPADFVERIGVAVENSPALVRGGAPNPEAARDLMISPRRTRRWPTSWKRWRRSFATAWSRRGTRPEARR